MEYDIIKNYEKVSMDWVEKFSAFEESASIHESMGGKNAIGPYIRPVWPGMRMCGIAFTVDARPGDNLIVHKAINMLQPGDILVIKTGLNDRGGLWGGMMTASAVAKGCSGLITDGCVRDSMLIKELKFPVFSRAISIRGATKGLPGKINHPVVIDDVVINPGDLIFGDNDGIVVIPKDMVESVYEKTLAREKKEEGMMKLIQSGKATTYDLLNFEAVFEKLSITEEK